MRIKKILSTQQKTQVIWEEKTDGGWNETGKKSPDPIDTKFIKALEALKPDYLEVLEEANADPEMWVITGIECSYRTEFLTLNIRITGYKTFKSSNGIDKHKTQYKAAYNNTGVSTAEENLLPIGGYDRVKKLIKAAMEYVEQDFSQVEMEFKPPEKADENQQDLKD